MMLTNIIWILISSIVFLNSEPTSATKRHGISFEFEVLTVQMTDTHTRIPNVT